MIRTITRFTLRGLLIICLTGAITGISVRASRGPRTRVYVIDASGSVLVKSGPESVTVEDALRLAQWDIQRSREDDPTALIYAGARPVIALPLAPRPSSIPESQADPRATDLDSALETAVAMAGDGDVVLMSDGRGSVDRAMALAAARSVPMHVMAVGPSRVSDVRIDGVDVPARIAPGERYTARITIASTGPARGLLRVGIVVRDFMFEGAGSQDIVIDGVPGQVTASLGIDDDCPLNNATAFAALERGDDVRTLLLSDIPLPRISGDLGWHDPAPYDVIVLNDIPLTRAQMDRVAAVVRAGAGLVILGGSNSYARGGWAETPIEEICPLWAFPDDRSALVVAMDCSGSMGQQTPRKIDVASSALGQALRLVRDDDELGAVAFSGDATPLGSLVAGRERGTIAKSLRDQVPGGPTRLVPAITRSIQLLEGATASKKRILLLTDGETEEPDAELQAAGARLRERRIDLIVVATATVNSKLALLGGAIIPSAVDAGLSEVVSEAFARSRELVLEPKSVTPGWPRPARINRTSAKPTAVLLARADSAPLAALAPAGRGQVAAVTWSLDMKWIGNGDPGLPQIADLVRRVTPTGSTSWAVSASIERDEATIRITAPGSASLPDRVTVLLDDRPLEAVRRGARTFECRAPVDAGMHFLRVDGRAVAGFVHSCPSEFRHLGIDETALARIAGGADGRLIRRIEDLPDRRGPDRRRPLRPALIIAAIALFFADLAVSTFWRTG